MFAIVTLFLAFDSIIHMLTIAPVTEAFAQLGYNPSIAFYLGIIELICVILYVVPRTSVLGALFLTGYLGGAVASNVRVEAPWFSTILFPIYVAILMWGALYIADERIRALLPLKKTA